MVCVCVAQVLLEESAELIEASIPLQKCLQELCKPVVIAKAKMDDALEVGEAIASTTKVLGEQHLKGLTLVLGSVCIAQNFWKDIWIHRSAESNFCFKS